MPEGPLDPSLCDGGEGTILGLGSGGMPNFGDLNNRKERFPLSFCFNLEVSPPLTLWVSDRFAFPSASLERDFRRNMVSFQSVERMSNESRKYKIQ